MDSARYSQDACLADATKRASVAAWKRSFRPRARKSAVGRDAPLGRRRLAGAARRHRMAQFGHKETFDPATKIVDNHLPVHLIATPS